MIRTGLGFDVHRLRKGRKLVLGGVEFKHRMGLDGHSDADVLCHAVADALLGAVADGDIGMHFPPSDAKWKDACSIDLLRRVGARVGRLKGRVLNVDATLIVEEPRIAPHAAAMRANIAAALGIAPHCVSVKATTAERMGAMGRREGIAAMAVATVDQKGRGRGKRA